MHNITTIDLLRHGESEGGDIFRGSTDVLLSDDGWQQMLTVAQGVEGWQKIITSPLRRCQMFAEYIAHEQNLQCVIDDDLQEVSFGDWDGKLLANVREQDSVMFNAFWQDPINNTPPNAESAADFCERIRRVFWSEVAINKGKHLLMVVHGGVIRAILQEILHSEPMALMRYEVPYACLSRIKIYHDAKTEDCWPQLIFHNR